ncbi:Ig-like domain-containing protein [Dyadobacter sp. CY323]|uniref:Ig-like domain-containing protein n=1 Tax=Dyadobacter sp. CY323 TaxID=2907302 RepID=UPI001F3D5FA6|nr:Ig-like domain-containing protein [Dyadobacter sp. CY323]MCE6989647.1 Ig-like domain-containing protein [Dyadobacter sp. CY323]
MRRVRLYITCSLTFFVLIQLFSCEETRKKGTASVIWKDKNAVAISFPEWWLTDKKGAVSVRVRAGYDNEVMMFGDLEKRADSITFTPLIPFTRGLSYEVFEGEKLLTSFSIPKTESKDAPRLLAVHPANDTVPENLLKIYLQFSQPMQEGKSAYLVTLIRNDGDTIKGAFLDLQPELWNENRTQLTLWLDPGRIKRDLQPNKKLGAPLQKNQGYKIVVSDKWKDTQGSLLARSYSKSFVTTSRDSLSPVPGNWKMNVPNANSVSHLQVYFSEPLDHGLLDEAFTIVNENGDLIDGRWQFNSEATAAAFIPNKTWKSGTYQLEVDTRLEDLASNNVNRPFDRDITKNSDVKLKQNFVKLAFQVH